MKKNERIGDYISGLVDPEDRSGQNWPAAYRGYFVCFNRSEYYEAHDVLEHLWLQETGDSAGFYKGLIQVAGAFVHLRKQYLRPHHHKDGRRLPPAFRLFKLGMQNLSPFGRLYLGLDLAKLEQICGQYMAILEDSKFTLNPWRPENAPQLQLKS